MELNEIIEQCPKNDTIINNMIKAYHTINNNNYNKIMCSISGGADSDVLLDICYKCDNGNKIEYVWFDTGLEYNATKEHLKYLEDKYKINIIKYRAIKPIPLTCVTYGEPFLSKNASNFIQRLQSHNFDFVDDSFENLYKKYPNCKGALMWWCNENGEGSSFNIKRNKWLKEFLIQNPPQFKIANKCCDYAKKKVAHKCIKENSYDLNITGVRKSEGGLRATTYKSCFDENGDGYDNYRPIFWYTDSDRKEYEDAFDIKHSSCYDVYGLKRTGCVGCPYGRNLEQELNAIQEHEPILYNAVNKIFGNSYEYTKKYKNFCNKMDSKYGLYKNYLKEINN